MTTQNRCGYARCAAPLPVDGPSPWFCGEECQRGWNEAQQSRPTSLPGGPVRGMTLTLVAVDEAAGIVASPEAVAEAAGPASARIYREPCTITPVIERIQPPPFRPGGLIRRILGYRT